MIVVINCFGRAISRTTLRKKAFEPMTKAEDYVVGETVEKRFDRVMNSNR